MPGKERNLRDAYGISVLTPRYQPGQHGSKLRPLSCRVGWVPAAFH